MRICNRKLAARITVRQAQLQNLYIRFGASTTDPAIREDIDALKAHIENDTNTLRDNGYDAAGTYFGVSVTRPVIKVKIGLDTQPNS